MINSPDSQSNHDELNESCELVNGRFFRGNMRQLDSIQSLSEFSKGLREIGIGTTLVLVAAFNLVVLPRILPNLNGLSTISLVLVVVGIWKLFSGKQTCWNCSLEIRQRWLLSWSLILDFALIAIRLLKKFWNPSWLALVGSCCGLMSLLFLVRFIYHLANIIDSKWGRALSHLTLSTTILAMTLVYGVVAMAFLQMAPPVRATMLLFAMLLGVLGLSFFLALCFQMSHSLKGFVDYLYFASAHGENFNDDQEFDDDLDDSDEADDRNETAQVRN